MNRHANETEKHKHGMRNLPCQWAGNGESQQFQYFRVVRAKKDGGHGREKCSYRKKLGRGDTIAINPSSNHNKNVSWTTDDSYVAEEIF